MKQSLLPWLMEAGSVLFMGDLQIGRPGVRHGGGYHVQFHDVNDRLRIAMGAMEGKVDQHRIIFLSQVYSCAAEGVRIPAGAGFRPRR